MNSSILLLLSLAAGGAPAAEAPAPRSAAAPLATVSDATFEDLIVSYDESYEAWKEAKRAAADVHERKALRDAHPAKEFYAEFAKLANAGEGRALLWMLKNMKDAGFEDEQLDPLALQLCERLAQGHVGADWFAEDGLDALFAQRSRLGEERLEQLVAGQLGRPGLAPEVTAGSLFRLGQMLARGDEAQRLRGLAYYERLVGTHPSSPLAAMAKGELFRLKHLQVGMVAPNFQAETYDGFGFQLSDFRGKVVVLDFWGFW